MPITGDRIQLLASSFMNEDPIEARHALCSVYRMLLCRPNSLSESHRLELHSLGELDICKHKRHLQGHAGFYEVESCTLQHAMYGTMATSFKISSLLVMAVDISRSWLLQKRVTWRAKYTFEHISSPWYFKFVCFLHTIRLYFYTLLLRLAGYPRIATKVPAAALGLQCGARSIIKIGRVWQQHCQHALLSTSHKQSLQGDCEAGFGSLTV